MHRFRHALLITAAAGFPVMMAAPVHAQQTGADSAEEQAEIIVTGTRARGRTRLDSISPIDVLPGNSLRQQGTTEIGVLSDLR